MNRLYDRKLIRPMAALITAAFLGAGCASPARVIFANDLPTEIFYKDGRVAYVATCRSANWGPCLEKAGMICKTAGYATLEQNSQRSYGEADKELVFACNAKP